MNNIIKYWKYIVFLIGFLILSAYLLYLAYESVRREMINDLNKSHAIHARQAARGIEAFFSDHITMLAELAENPHVVDLDQAGVQMMKAFFKSHHEEIIIISRIDREGRIINAVPYNRGVINQTVTDLAVFREVKDTGRPAVSDVFTNRRGHKTIIIHAPITKKGLFNGTLSAQVPMDLIASRYIQDIRIGDEGYAWVISKKGVELSCPVPGHVGKSVFVNCQDFPAILAMAERMIRQEEGFATYRFNQLRKANVIPLTKHAFFMPIKLGNTFWSIVVATPEQEVTGTLKDFRNQLIIIAILLIAGIAVFLYLLFKNNILVKEIEKRKIAEENNRLLALVLDQIRDRVTVTDLTGKITYVNEAQKLSLGFPPEELIGRSVEIYGNNAEDGINYIMIIKDTLENGFWRGEVVHYTKDGVARILDCRTQLVRDDSGAPLAIAGISSDITERKKEEKALRESENKYQSVFENTGTGMLISEDDTTISVINAEFENITGYKRQEIEGKRKWTDFVDKSDLEKMVSQHKMRRIDKRKAEKAYEFRLLRKDGGIRNIYLTADLIPGTSKTVASMIDITDYKKAEADRRQLEDRLQRAEKMEALGTLAGGVAHDLNNVLGIIVGYAELLLMNPEKSKPIRSSLENIMNGGQRAAAIVQDLLTLARRGVSERKVINLNKIIAEWRQSLEYMNMSTFHPAVQLNFNLAPELMNIAGSSVHVGKTIFNLASNAIEAMPKGGVVTIKTANQYLDRPIQGYDEVREGDYVVLAVSDTGEGIAPEDMKHIFEPFYTKKIMGRSGTGLGLAVVWGTVKDHQGYINVESEKQKGSIFTIYFPVTREDFLNEKGITAVVEYLGGGESILVVDDVEEQRELAAAMLQRLNYKVATLPSGEEAVAYLKEQSADLVVLDMIMAPGMDGLDTYRSILAINPQQKAIIVSGFSETYRVSAALGLGAGAYVRKPYVLEKLGLAVKSELKRKSDAPAR